MYLVLCIATAAALIVLLAYLTWVNNRSPKPRRGVEEIEWFSTKMQLKLDRNAHKDGWIHDNPWHLVDRLKEEVLELEQALALASTDSGEVDPDLAEAIILEAADVANFAMMTADVARRGGWSRGQA